MIVFEKLEIRNFLSIGNKALAIDLNSSGVNLIVGNNGSGKSAIISALYYVLYGKSFKTLSILELINFSNKKKMLVVLDFSIDGIKYQIRRGLKPTVFEILKNGKPLDYVSKADSQAYLNEQILKMDSKTFKQLCVICSSSYVPFLKLTLSEKRTVVDDILGFNIFTEMLEILKQKLSRKIQEIESTEKELANIKNEFDVFQEKQNTLSETIKTYMQADAEKFDSHKKSLPIRLGEIDEIGKEIKDFDFESLSESLKACKSKLENLENLSLREKTLKNEILKKMSFFKDEKICPTCTQEISQKISQKILNDLKESLSEKEDFLNSNSSEKEKILESIENLNLKISEYNAKKSEYNDKKKLLLDIKQEMLILEKNIKKYEDDIKNSQKQQKNVISNIKTKMRKKIEEIDSLTKTKKEYEFISSLLKDDGIKKIIIRNYLPMINTIIKKYLNILELNYSFMFDENFSPVIKMYGRDVCEYNSLSEGEMARLNFILLFVFREFSKIRSSLDTNLLFIDEIGDSTLDSSGIFSLNSILSIHKNISIFIISHYPENYSTITEKTYTFSKENMFTNMRIS